MRVCNSQDPSSVPKRAPRATVGNTMSATQHAFQCTHRDPDVTVSEMAKTQHEYQLGIPMHSSKKTSKCFSADFWYNPYSGLLLIYTAPPSEPTHIQYGPCRRPANSVKSPFRSASLSPPFVHLPLRFSRTRCTSQPC